MALCDDWFQQSFRIIWILAIFATESRSKKTQIFYMQDADCNADNAIGGATVYSHTGTTYEHKVDCQMTFKAVHSGWRLMMRLERIDIPDMSFKQLCNDALYIYDAKTILGRPVAQISAGGVCGDEVPAVMYSSGQYLTVYFRTDKSGPRGAGFKFIVTAFSEDKEACNKRFLCGNRKCIDPDLVCDDVDHCGDGSDESGNTNCHHIDDTIAERLLSLGITAAIAISVGSAVVLIVCVACSICCCCRCWKRVNQDQGGGTATGGGACNHAPTTSVTINNGTHPAGHAAYQHSAHPMTAPPNGNGGYYPMYQVAPPAAAARSSDGSSNKPLVTYSPFKQTTGAPYCPQPPPSYHRSHTPTSSRSGRSHHSGESAVKFNENTNRVALPVHL